MQFLRRLKAAAKAARNRVANPGAALSAAILGLPFLLAGTAMAQKPEPWQMGMQAPFSPVAEDIHSLHNFVLIIITAITIFVAVLLLIVMLKFNRRANPTPSQTSHHTGLEVAWTIIPALILVAIAIPSFRLVYKQDRTHEADMTLKVIAHQWNWEYNYPDHGGLNFVSAMLPEDEAKKAGKLRLLDVDNELVLPVGKNIRILTSSSQVIHSFFIPALGVQRYAIPGRTIETWVRITAPGTYYGQCNQICGKDHARMPIAVRAVTQQEFDAWLVDAKKKFASGDPVATRQLAALDLTQR
jgi:cytochrome c oxidase subunit 2